MKFLNYIQFLWFIFALLDPDPNTDLIESGSGSETLVGTQFTKERTRHCIRHFYKGSHPDLIIFVVTFFPNISAAACLVFRSTVPKWERLSGWPYIPPSIR
jgi:hypothetical protein